MLDIYAVYNTLHSKLTVFFFFFRNSSTPTTDWWLNKRSSSILRFSLSALVKCSKRQNYKINNMHVKKAVIFTVIR